ncbi:hypothetical protein [Streptomyces flavofungini]|uniref:hypothetical protein n=1 Tax=Streptomyces flavofungini TaxID=68200 RepID=UPI0025B25B2E|nr:hypothetical protein [Streptomyces flavofungini]WJV47668.1 hypothetical protein QUY26_20340 [Streptomyces flavofungini]
MRKSSTRREHRATRRALRATLRRRTAGTRATRRATKAVATGTPQTARTRLVAAGLDDATAHRFSAAFSRGVTPDATREATVKLKGRARKAVKVKLYAAATFAARLATYRPKDRTIAARFEALTVVAV